MPDIICEVECPACGEMVVFTELGVKVCPHCKGAKAELAVTEWVRIEDKE